MRPHHVRTVSAQVSMNTHRRAGCALDGRYRPHIIVDDGEMLGVTFWLDDGGVIEPGETADILLDLIYPQVDYSAVVPGARFHVLEGRTVVGTGIITTETPSSRG